EELGVQIKYKSLGLNFIEVLQPSVLNFAQRSQKPIKQVQTAFFTPNLSILMELPRMSLLTLRYCEGFSDQDVIDIARKEHKYMSIPCNLSDPTILCRLIKIVQASKHIVQLNVDVSTSYFHRFLASIQLREVRNKLVDISTSNSPIDLFKFNRYHINYYLDCGSCYVNIHAFERGESWYRNVTIINEKLSFDLHPSHSFNLERL
ncbi:hypothetical protein PFISCL1PPCAC_24991, partial [Pristionchus fissidentatus]